MFENLWEEDPKIQKCLAVKEAEGRAKGQAEGEVTGMRRAIVKSIAQKYPSLGEFALNQVWKLGSLDALEQLLEHINNAGDEKTVLLLLNDVKA